MLTNNQIYKLRKAEGLTLRDVAQYTQYCFQYLSDLETGRALLNSENHDEFVYGINKAAEAKVNGEIGTKRRGKRIVN